ncbi:hypothetical protein LAZ40_06825 [Cereibacter sphaeroides]|uniref:hypothetical protein n=1 Tax=Cereibacter sphaeroides TaxID=1063 RepID=UPI001F41FD47|nr:hypothetical protein [Cereibacter sphaeroides]MCE6958760.1 hypothetical protein [Cereibacter sphaeroides]MCE6973366.1 hypothetical protein [Cereibacter sphaeroides]
MTQITRDGDSFERRMRAGSATVHVSSGLDGGSRWLGIVFEADGGREVAHRFPNIGDNDWRTFLCSLDKGHVGDKFFGLSRFEADFVGTCRNIRQWIREGRACGQISSDVAKGIRATIQRHEEARMIDIDRRLAPGAAVQDLFLDLDRQGVRSLQEHFARRTTCEFHRFIERVWTPLVAELSEDLARNPAPAVRAEEPEAVPDPG